MSWKPDPEAQQRLRKLFGDRWQGDAPRAFRKGLLAALVSRDAIQGDAGPPRWHISLQHADRVPSWDELAAAVHELRPGVPFAIGIPPKSQWINVHERVLHAWELRDEPLTEQWRAERRGDRPT